MQSTIIYKNKYIIRNTFRFKDGELFRQDIAKFNDKGKAITFINKYRKLFRFIRKELLK